MIGGVLSATSVWHAGSATDTDSVTVSTLHSVPLLCWYLVMVSRDKLSLAALRPIYALYKAAGGLAV